jgi:hypothetical protein
MAKEKIFIVLSHKHSLKKKTNGDWEVQETVEFVNQLRNKHISSSSVIGDYINRKMVIGERFGFSDYAKFEEYVYKKYEKQMAELDAAYSDQRLAPAEILAPFKDQFGNTREKTVFDL